MNLQQKLIAQTSTSNQIPTATESEKYLIGACLLDEGAAAYCLKVLRHYHFWATEGDQKNKNIWKLITRLTREKRAVDLMTVCELWQKGRKWLGDPDPGYLMQCQEVAGGGLQIVSEGKLITHREKVTDSFIRRKMIDLGATVQFWGFNASYSDKLFEVWNRRRDRLNELRQLTTESDDLKQLKFDPEAPVQMEDFTLTYHAAGQRFGIAEQGCMVAVSGASGTRKTTLLLGILSTAYKNKTVCGFKLQNRGKMLFFDTEQPQKRFQHVQRRLYNMCYMRNTGEKFEAYTLRKKDYEQRIHFIEKVLRKNKEISVVVIDGIADLVSSINNEEECNALVQKLMEWSDKYKAIVFAVLHDTKSTGKMGGHLGSFMEKKQDCEINVQLSDNPNYSTVTFRKTRGSMRPPSFQFTQDANRHPVIDTPEAQPVAATGTGDFYPNPEFVEPSEDIPFYFC